ncbi:MAG TPA: ACP phosphodiesterase [Gemmataceae bacterium]|jgi:acyl carrier protein phosphodiesterase|nr:ACP phosphodiesterase [Gemmataceae bacterium]
MNWLAHALLSNPEPESRLGNLLADLVKGRDRAAMSAAFLAGVRQHQAIDAFTDGHPVVHRSRARIGSDFGHTTGILVDVFYDHFLALDWVRYSAEPLAAFTAGVYADMRAGMADFPAEAHAELGRMIDEDRLGSYRRLDGIAAALRRVSLRLQARTGRDFGLERGVAELVAHFDGLRADFAEFFPQLVAHVGPRGAAGPGPAA